MSARRKIEYPKEKVMELARGRIMAELMEAEWKKSNK